MKAVVDVVNMWLCFNENSRFWMKNSTLDNVGGPSPISWRPNEEKLRIPGEENIVSQDWSINFFMSFKPAQFSSVQFSHSVASDSLQPHESQHARPPCPISHPAISSSVVPFSSCPRSLPASGSFPMSQMFAWGVSASASVLPMNTQDWSLLGWTGWISLQSKVLSRVFSNTTVQKHQFFSSQLSLKSNSHNHTWPLEKP